MSLISQPPHRLLCGTESGGHWDHSRPAGGPWNRWPAPQHRGVRAPNPNCLSGL